MSLKQTIGKGAKVEYGLGRDLQGIKRAVSTTPKHDQHGLGYQPGNQGENEQIGKQKGNKMANSRLIIPPIHLTFRLRGDKSQIYMKFTFIYLVFCIVYHLFWAF